MEKKVSVIVPVYRPDDKFYKLLQQLKQQTWPVHRIILMNPDVGVAGALCAEHHGSDL